jgi:hypothetical protein
MVEHRARTVMTSPLRSPASCRKEVELLSLRRGVAEELQ